ncbi:glycosyltransferase family 2 protein [Hydrogenimonas thermophila]|uniref:Glycosyltransferase, GT2 family n=1 Tax=Hydrogenimonas thermophila TaxID=223786 RepID=A0A1I5KPX3_9BACT|nr:glycosyltransferase family 2 protein [Hydrogenimonas thermophila]SFO87159.1 Glycosyltransferase, GT2 family [Hydrogenimonas thermophila]
MKVDLVIATYNRASFLKQTLDNVLEYQNELNKIFVINNNSQDNTMDILIEYEKKSPKIKVFNMDKNLGAPGGKNIGLKESKADVVIVLDDDAIFCSYNPIKEIINIFKQEKDLGIIQFKIINYQTKKILNYEFPGKLPEKNGDKEFYTGYFIGAGHAIKREMLEKVGYYPDDFFYAHEELDLSYRAINNGYKIKYYPKVAIYHKKAPGGRLSPKEVIKHNFRNRLIMNYKYLPLKYRIINNSLWFLKTLKDSKNLLIPLKAIVEYIQIKDDLKINKLKEKAIDYCRQYNGRLYY